MATKKKMLQAAAGQAGGAGLDITEVFSTYLYTGNGSTQTITNGIDLAGEGGLTWIKNRGPNAANHALYDTERGVRNFLMSSTTNAQISASAGSGLTAFNSNGFTLGTSWIDENNNNQDTVSWTFRKAPKFFDVVTYTGTGSAQNIAHNLGSVPGMIIVKQTNGARDWPVYHRGIDASNPSHYKIPLNKTEARANEANIWNDTEPTSTHFTVGSDGETGGNGNTYVAYVFAHNDGNGGFGPDGDQDIIKCGSYTATGSDVDVDLGWEPQFIITRNVSRATEWNLQDTMRGMTDNSWTRVIPNDSSADFSVTSAFIFPTSTGFKVTSVGNEFGNAGDTVIYMAIRRGPLAPPESATEVFDVQTFAGNASANRKINTGFVVDANITWGRSGESACLAPRLYDGMHEISSTGVPYNSLPDWMDDDYNDGFIYPTPYSLSNNNGVTYVSYSWKRAPGYFDAVAYTGDSPGGVGVQTVSHNLGVAPEMIWFKRRDSTGGWGVLVTALGTVESGGIEYGQGAYLNETSAFATSGWWGSPYVAPTATEFTVRGSTPNASGGDYIAYLFASLDGISKVGSYTGNGTSQNIDCGFTSGARFVLIKKTNSTANWIVFDSARGIVSGNDPYLFLNTASAEGTGYDLLDPYASGFNIASGDATINASGDSYIFYAIA